MLDRPIRRLLAPALTAGVGPLARLGVRPNQLTLAGLLFAIIAAVLAARHQMLPAATVWLLSRLLDGMDGALARTLTTPAESRLHDQNLGGYYDIIADFAAYAALPLGVAVAQPSARLAIAFLLGAYYLSGATFLAFSSIAERKGVVTDTRSLQFIGRLAEGTETIVVHTAMVLWPQHAEPLAWSFGALVAVGVVERVLVARRLLRTT